MPATWRRPGGSDVDTEPDEPACGGADQPDTPSGRLWSADVADVADTGYAEHRQQLDRRIDLDQLAVHDGGARAVVPDRCRRG